MLCRPVVFSAAVSLLAVFAPWSRDARAEDPGQAAAAPAAIRQPVVTAIDVVDSEAGTQVTISGDTALAYEYFVIGGKSLVIDIAGASSTVSPADRPVDDEFFSRIQVAALTGKKPGVRVAFALKKPDMFTVRGDNGRIVVTFPMRTDSASPAQTRFNRVLGVTGNRLAGAFRVAVKTDVKPSYRVLQTGDPTSITLAIDGARLEPNSRKDSDYSALDAPITRVSAWSEPKDPTVVLVEILMRQPLPSRVFADESGLKIEVDLVSAVSARMEAAPAVMVSPAPAPGPTPSGLPAPSSKGPAAVDKGSTGRAITLDFVDADIADIFRLIADVSGMSIVATEDVKGKRSVQMIEVPWDQALDLILKTNIPQLEKIQDRANVIRIVTLARLMQEQSDAEKKKIEALRLQEDSRKLEQLREDALAEEKVLRGKKQKRDEITAAALRDPLTDYTIALKNSEVADVWHDIKIHLQEQEVVQTREFSSGKTTTKVNPDPSTGTPVGVVPGTTQTEDTTIEWRINEETCPNCLINIDLRTKTLFFKMYPLYMEKVLYIVRTLDAPRKIDSVMIEARIVEVVSNFSQALGIQWGGRFVADPAHGNATQYAFPNSIGIGGSQTGSYLVNLPANNAVGGIGLSLGHIANTLSLDVKLSALETLGKTKILSNPKIMTLNNKLAKINIGSQLPIPTTDATGNRTVMWKDVGILLDVTPEITSDDKVVMKVNIEKSSRGVTVSTTEGDMFSIERRGAETSVIVADGETTVIGGIYIQSDSDNRTGLPWLSKIPVLGWLFKADGKSTDRTELMIFLTPRINRYR